MKKHFLAVFFVLSLTGMGSMLQAQTGPNFTYANYMEFGSPMWVTPAEGPAPIMPIEAVQVSADGHITQIEPSTGWQIIKNVKKGDVVVRYLEKGKSVTEVYKSADFLNKYTLKDGSKIKLHGVLRKRKSPRLDTRVEAKRLFNQIKNGAADIGLNYDKVPTDVLTNMEVYYVKEGSGKSFIGKYALAPLDGFLTTQAGERVPVLEGSFLELKNVGERVNVISPKYLANVENYVVGYRNGQLIFYIFDDVRSMPNSKTGIATYNYEVTIYDSRTGSVPHQKYTRKYPVLDLGPKTSAHSFVKSYNKKAGYPTDKLMEKYVGKGYLPISTPAILESYMRYQEAMNRIALNFSDRHTSEFARAALAEDIKIAKEARAKTRNLMSKHKAEFKAVANKKVYNKNLRPQETIRMKGFFRKVMGGTLVSVVVVAGFQGVEMLLDRMSESDNSTQNVAVLRASVQDRDRYINTIKTNPELLVYMPTNLMSEAYMRRDFDQPAMAAELYLFNQFVEETQNPGSVAQQLLARVEEEQAQSEASALAEDILQQAALSHS